MSGKAPRVEGPVQPDAQLKVVSKSRTALVPCLSTTGFLTGWDILAAWLKVLAADGYRSGCVYLKDVCRRVCTPLSATFRF